MSVKNSYFFILLLSFFLVACSGAESNKNKTKQKAEVSFSPTFPKVNKRYVKEKRKVINQYYQEYLGGDRFNGMFLVAKNGQIISERYNGFSNVGEDIKISSNTPLHLASISKYATALATLRLVDQKKLMLDDDIRNYLPDFPYEGISIRMLLNHRSGVPYYGYFTFETWPMGKMLTNKDVLLLLKKHKFPLNFKPDNHFAYCNTNYALLALIIEKATKKRFPLAMKELIFDPLKMKHSFIMDYTREKESVSQSYSSGMVRQSFDYLDDVYGDKNMYSTVRDLLKMDMGTYSTNFLSKASRKEMFKGYSYENSGKKNYGLGCRIVELKGKDPYFFHSGWWHGNKGCYATLRADTVCVIALTNTNSQCVYSINRLSTHFGNYPFEFIEE
jgi:CubicO group peptidase (beta-lactamase class C family)